MKKILFLGSLVLVACGRIEHTTEVKSCTIKGTVVTCPDGTSSDVRGPAGMLGPQGIPGIAGIGCSVAGLAIGSAVAPNGGSLITCGDGSSSIVLNGSPGVNGSNGKDGTPGTVITPVKFCPGFTQSYPNTFSESGVCIGGKIWGVYSENGGFLAELPPGVYQSNGINASCVFTIGPNCVVTQGAH